MKKCFRALVFRNPRGHNFYPCLMCPHTLLTKGLASIAKVKTLNVAQRRIEQLTRRSGVLCLRWRKSPICARNGNGQVGVCSVTDRTEGDAILNETQAKPAEAPLTCKKISFQRNLWSSSAGYSVCVIFPRLLPLVIRLLSLETIMFGIFKLVKPTRRTATRTASIEPHSC